MLQLMLVQALRRAVSGAHAHVSAAPLPAAAVACRCAGQRSFSSAPWQAEIASRSGRDRVTSAQTRGRAPGSGLWSRRLGGLLAGAAGAALGWRITQPQRQSADEVASTEEQDPDFTAWPPCHPALSAGEQGLALAELRTWLEREGADIAAVDFAPCQVRWRVCAVHSDEGLSGPGEYLLWLLAVGLLCSSSPRELLFCYQSFTRMPHVWGGSLS